MTYLWCHVYSGRSHWYRWPSRHNIQLPSLPRNMRGRSLHRIRKSQIRAEPRHKISSCNEIHWRLERFENELETSSDFLLANFADRADFFEGTRDAFLSTGYVEASWCYGIVRTPFQIFPIVYLKYWLRAILRLSFAKRYIYHDL